MNSELCQINPTSMSIIPEPSVKENCQNFDQIFWPVSGYYYEPCNGYLWSNVDMEPALQRVSTNQELVRSTASEEVESGLDGSIQHLLPGGVKVLGLGRYGGTGS